MDLLGLTRKRKREEAMPSVVFNKADEVETNDNVVIGYDDIPSLEEAGFTEENGQIVKVSDPFTLVKSTQGEEPTFGYEDDYQFIDTAVEQKRIFESESFADTLFEQPVILEVEEADIEEQTIVEAEPVEEATYIFGPEPVEEVIYAPEPEPELEEEKPFIAKLTPEHYELGKDSYQKAFSISAEALAISVLEHNQVTNMSLSAFGEFGKMYQPQVLSVIEFGAHRFIGRSLSDIEKMKLFYQIEKFFMESSEDSMVLKLTQTITFQEVKYLTLIATPDELREYSTMFFQEVSINLHEPDENNLVAVIKRCR